ncbi:hypothetical protein M433DRAFT_138165 [Acidomyces richmondensis BFW]|nr:hypothetical protein M433DRAFT_138165 [Acidomyces richmondensis BFW]
MTDGKPKPSSFCFGRSGHVWSHGAINGQGEPTMFHAVRDPEKHAEELVKVAFILRAGERRTTRPSSSTATLLAACPHPAEPGRHERAGNDLVRLAKCVLEDNSPERASGEENAMRTSVPLPPGDQLPLAGTSCIRKLAHDNAMLCWLLTLACRPDRRKIDASFSQL